MEYNAHYGPSIPWVQNYNPDHRWKGTTYFGASLKVLEQLAAEKNYSLVCCNFMGMNAFFVRNDLLSEKFAGPYTAENHFEPVRYFLYRLNGHPRELGGCQLLTPSAARHALKLPTLVDNCKPFTYGGRRAHPDVEST